jgi:hypothetical protein
MALDGYRELPVNATQDRTVKIIQGHPARPRGAQSLVTKLTRVDATQRPGIGGFAGARSEKISPGVSLLKHRIREKVEDDVAFSR